MTRIAIVLAVALPILAMSQEAEKKTPAAPEAVEKAAVAKKPAKRKDGKLLNIAADGTITYHVDRDSAVRAIVAKLQKQAAESKKTEDRLVNEIDRLRGKLQRIESNCKKKR